MDGQEMFCNDQDPMNDIDMSVSYEESEKRFENDDKSELSNNSVPNGIIESLSQEQEITSV